MGVCSLLCKTVIVIFTLLYTVVGIAFLVVGVWLRAGNNSRGIDDSSLVIGEWVLIVLGIVMVITAACGDVGSFKDNTSSLATLCVLLVILMASQIALYVQQQKMGPRLVEFYMILYAIYVSSGDPVIGVTLRVMHNTLNCCGALGVVGLDPTSHICPEKSGFLDHVMFPCPYVLTDVFSAKPPVAMGIFYGNGVLLILCLLCSLALGRMLQRTVTPPYIQFTQSVSSYPDPHTQPQLHPYVSPADGPQSAMVLTPMYSNLLADA